MRRGTWKKALASAAAVVLTMTGLTAPAEAQAGNVVVFGDSYTASPNDVLNAAARSSVDVSSQQVSEYPSRGGCLQHPQNWPRQMAAATGLEVIDWSCTAETSQTVLSRIDEATKFNHINPNTRAVYLAVGGNNFGPHGISQGSQPLNEAAMRSSFSAHMGQAAAKIRAVAPHAKIIVAGLPRVTNGTGVCLFNVIPNMPGGIPVPGAAIETTIRDMQRDGAYANGMGFVDNYVLTAGHDTCAPDHKRYVSGGIDTTTPGKTMSFHPTVSGHAALAHNNAAAL